MIKIKKIKITPKASYIFIETDLSLKKGNILKMIYNPDNEENLANYWLEVVGVETMASTLTIVLADIGYYQKVDRIKSNKMFDLMEAGKIEIASKDEILKATKEKHYC